MDNVKEEIDYMEKAFVEWSDKHIQGGLSGLCRKLFYAGWEAKEAFDERKTAHQNDFGSSPNIKL